MNPLKSSQILALASLSSPYFDANPFWGTSDDMPGFRGPNLPRPDVATMAPGLRLWKSAGYSNQACLMFFPATRF
jgi:hypothetical protein